MREKNSNIKRSGLLFLLCLVLMPVNRLAAQTFTTLRSFDATLAANPTGILLWSNTLYGTLNGIFPADAGSSVFRLNIDGTGFSNIYTFSPPVGDANADGAFPPGGLIESNNRLYGTTTFGGYFAHGTVFALNTDGTGFTNLYSFSAFNPPGYVANADGANPASGVVLSGNTLYGTTQDGGEFEAGTVFRIDTDGTGFAVLYTFTGGADGSSPLAGLVLSGNLLYGTTASGGSSGNGTVFAINTDGTGFTNLHAFSAYSSSFTNVDGGRPSSPLTISGTRLFGATFFGGGSRNGTVFTLNTDGTGFSTLHSFSPTTSQTNSDGAIPIAGLLVSGDFLYGTADTGGNWGQGTIFALRTDGTAFTTLYSFSAANGPLSYKTNTDGANPQSSLVLAGNTLYGTARAGGTWGYGTAFRLTFSPQLSIVPAGSNMVLSWPTNYAGFDYSGYALQTTTDPGAPMWTTNLPAHVVVNGQNTVTTPISGAQQFFRLTQ